MSLRIRIIKSLVDFNEKLIFEQRLRKYYQKVFNGNINLIIDVGSNKGQTIDFFQKINPKCHIYGFEPNYKLFQQLIQKYAKKENIKLHNFGISNKSGKKVFQENVFDYTSTFEELNLGSKYLKNKSKVLGVKPENLIKDRYEVNVVTLSDFINKEVKNPIDILKIDTEGHEYSCLLGLFENKLNQKIKYIQLENHNDDMYVNKISFDKTIDLLNKNNFEIDIKVKHGFGNIEEVIFKNNF